MKEWILQNWQLCATVGLSVINFLITLFVHSKSKARISGLEDASASTTYDISQIVEFNELLIKLIQKGKENSEKKD